MLWNLPTDERGRHRRATLYAVLSFVFAVLGYTQLGLDQAQTIVYAALAFSLFHVYNYHAMFGVLLPSREERPLEN